MKRTARSSAAAFGLAAMLAGCAQTPGGSTVQVMPGPGKSFDAFQQDTNSCKQFASNQVAGQADAANGRALAITGLTIALGAASGGAIGGGNAAGIGAATGAAVGSGLGGADNANSQASIQMQYDAAYSQCMYAKGNNVPGYAPVAGTGTGSISDPTVRAIQQNLIRLGYLNGGADGVLGPKTSAAISNYEASVGMAVDGSASQQLLAALRSTPGGSSARRATPASAPAASASASAPAPAASTATWVAPVGSAPAAAPAATSSSGWVQPAATP